MLPPLTLKLLDAPALFAAGQPLPALAAVDVALLAVLALQGQQERRHVAALLWPDADPDGAATNLRQRIYRLKRHAGRAVVEGQRIIGLLDDLQHDMQDFAERLAADPQHGQGGLLGTLEFPEHEALAGWLGGQREALARTRVRVLARMAQQMADEGRVPQAQKFVHAWLQHAPLDEQAHRLQIQLLYRLGNRAAALAAYHHCEQLLQAELGVVPSAPTRALLAQLQQDAAPAPALPTAIPMALLRPPRLVARTQAWAQLERAASTGGTLVLEGEAGLGKSRLLGDFLAGRDGWCLGAASPGDTALPMALLARLLSACVLRWGLPPEEWVCRELARVVPEAGTPASDSFASVRLQQAVRTALLHWRQHGLAGLALDDLHFADPASLDVLLPLASNAASPGLPWVLATRPPIAAGGLDAWPRVSLQLLALEEIGELLRTLGLAGLDPDVWAPALLQRTGGNPLFLLQTLTATFEAGQLNAAARPAGAGPSMPLPTPVLAPSHASLSALLAARLERLSVQARAIARLACVAGPDFTLAMACELLDARPAALADPWLELQSAQVMRDERFVHDLIREAAVSITPPEVRHLIHAQVASALERAGAPAGRVAEHWHAAGRWPEAAQAYEQAAAQAHARGAVADELLKLQAATRCHRAAGGALALAAAFATEHRALGLSVGLTQLGDDTRQACEGLLAAAATDEQRAQAQVLLAHYWAERYEPELALEPAQAAFALARAGQQHRLALLAAQRLGGALSRMGRNDEALQTLHPLAVNLDALSADERLNWLTDFGLALDYADQRPAALEVFDAVVREALASERWLVAASALSPKANVLVYLGRTADGLQAMEQALALCRRAGIDGAGLLVDEASCAGNLRDLGQFSLYLQRAERLPQALREAGSAFWAANAEHDLATAYAWLGRPDLALRTLAGAIDGLSPPMQAARLATRARLARQYGVGVTGPHPQQLLQQALRLLDEAQVGGRSHIRLSITVQAALDAAPAEGLATATQIEAEAVQRHNAILAGSASGVRLRILLAQGELQAASRVAMALLDRLGDAGPPAGVYRPELWWLCWQALRQHAPERSRAVRDQAVQWVQHVAQAQVPALYREGFLTRNPVNAALLAGGVA